MPHYVNLTVEFYSAWETYEDDLLGRNTIYVIPALLKGVSPEVRVLIKIRISKEIKSRASMQEVVSWFKSHCMELLSDSNVNIFHGIYLDYNPIETPYSTIDSDNVINIKLKINKNQYDSFRKDVDYLKRHNVCHYNASERLREIIHGLGADEFSRHKGDIVMRLNEMKMFHTFAIERGQKTERWSSAITAIDALAARKNENNHNYQNYKLDLHLTINSIFWPTMWRQKPHLSWSK